MSAGTGKNIDAQYRAFNVKPDDKLADDPDRQDRVRRTPFPPADQPAVVVQGD